jgi:Selenoprotein, putative
LREEARRSRIEALAKAVVGWVGAEIFDFLRELSGEMHYQRYVDGRRRCWFPERSIMTRWEYERWRTELQEQRPPEARC